MSKPVPIQSGIRYGKLVTLEHVRSGQDLILVRCDCGTTKQIRARTLRATIEPNRSCGCTRKKHGLIKTASNGERRLPPLYTTWAGMRERCNNPNNVRYAQYGGRGIKVCREWDHFPTFVRDVGPKPTPRHTLDRIDNDGPYCKDNCRWATASEQVRNSSRGSRLTIDGVTRNISEWARLYNTTTSAISGRLRSGWSAKDAVTLPPKRRRLIEGKLVW